MIKLRKNVELTNERYAKYERLFNEGRLTAYIIEGEKGSESFQQVITPLYLTFAKHGILPCDLLLNIERRNYA